MSCIRSCWGLRGGDVEPHGSWAVALPRQPPVAPRTGRVRRGSPPPSRRGPGMGCLPRSSLPREDLQRDDRRAAHAAVRDLRHDDDSPQDALRGAGSRHYIILYYFILLYYILLYYILLYYIIVYHIILYHIILYYIILYYIISYHIILYYINIILYYYSIVYYIIL